MVLEESDKEVVRILEAHNLPGIADIHVHFMPDNVMAKVWSYFDSKGPLIGRDWPIQYRLGTSERVALLKELGVRRYSALNYPHRPGMAEWLNEWSAGFAGSVSQVAHSATFYPEPNAPVYVAKALQQGARIFKAHVQVGNYDPRDPVLDGVWEILEASGTPVVIHCGNAPVPGDYTDINNVREVLLRYPSLTLVVAHMGNHQYSQTLDLAFEFENVHLDTTMVFTPFTEASSPYPKTEYGRLALMKDRVVFGSDFPNIPYPYAVQLSSLVALDLGDEWLRAVVWDNGMRLMGEDDISTPALSYRQVGDHI